MESNTSREIFSVLKYKNGIILNLYGVKGISLNQYKGMHFGKIAQIKQNYRSILDASLVNLYFPKDKYEMTKEGLRLKSPLFSICSITWGIGFFSNRSRDLGNYTQKILLDAIVGSNLIEDDNSNIVCEDIVFFMSEKQDQIKIFIKGLFTEEYKYLFENFEFITPEIEKYKKVVFDDSL